MTSGSTTSTPRRLRHALLILSRLLRHRRAPLVGDILVTLLIVAFLVGTVAQAQR